MKYRIILLFILFSNQSCNICKDVYNPYINHFLLKNTTLDSVARIALYFYLNNTNFNNPIDSVRVSLRQEGANLAIGYYPFSDTLKTFRYKIEFLSTPTQEYKIKILEDGCNNCGDCNQATYPRVLTINGDTLNNIGNVIELN